MPFGIDFKAKDAAQIFFDVKAVDRRDTSAARREAKISFIRASVADKRLTRAQRHRRGVVFPFDAHGAVVRLDGKRSGYRDASSASVFYARAAFKRHSWLIDSDADSDQRS